MQGAKKVIFTPFHSGKLKLTFTSPNIISTSPKNVLMSRLISQFFCNLNSSKKFTCPSDKLITKFSSPIAKSASPGLSDTTFFARCDMGVRCHLLICEAFKGEQLLTFCYEKGPFSDFSWGKGGLYTGYTLSKLWFLGWSTCLTY